MNETLLRSWWLLALRGAVAIVFGSLAILWPAITLVTLAALFAAFALLAGAVWTFGAIRNRRSDPRWWLPLLLGVVSIGAGVIAAIDPAVTTIALVLLMGANALVSGVIDIAVALRCACANTSRGSYCSSSVAWWRSCSALSCCSFRWARAHWRWRGWSVCTPF